MTGLSGATSLLSLSFLIGGRRVVSVTSQGGVPRPSAPMLLITFKELFLLLTWVSPVGFFWAVG